MHEMFVILLVFIINIYRWNRESKKSIVIYQKIVYLIHSCFDSSFCDFIFLAEKNNEYALICISDYRKEIYRQMDTYMI